MKYISNKYKKITVLILLVFCCFVISTGEAFCDSISADLTGNNSCNIGDTVTLSLTYKGTQFGTAKAEIEYDTSVLQYESCSAVAYGGNGVISISLTSGGSDTLSCMIKFKAIKAGDAYVKAHTIEAYGLDETQYSAATKTMNISVKNPSTAASSNANLSHLSVSAGSLSPAFSPSKTSYTVNVANNVTVCTVSATAQDNEAKISISGSPNLSVGNNVRSVTVTAENGTTKTYTITIIRAAAGSSEPGEDQEEQPPEERPEEIRVTVGDKEYIVNEDISENDFPVGFTMTVIQYNDVDVPVIVDMDLNYTLIMLTDPDTGDSAWFFYDDESGEFSASTDITAEEAMEYANLKAKIAAETSEEEGLAAGDRLLIIAFGSTVGLLAICIIILQAKILSRKKKRKAAPAPALESAEDNDEDSLDEERLGMETEIAGGEAETAETDGETGSEEAEK